MATSPVMPDGASKVFKPVEKTDVTKVSQDLHALVEDFGFVSKMIRDMAEKGISLNERSMGSSVRDRSELIRNMMKTTDNELKRKKIDDRIDGPKRGKEIARNRHFSDTQDRILDTTKEHQKALTKSFVTIQKTNTNINFALKNMGNQSEFMKSVLEDNRTEQGRALNNIVEDLKDQFSNLFSDEKKRETEQGKKRLTELSTAIEEAMKHMSESGMGGGRGGRGGRGGFSMGSGGRGRHGGSSREYEGSFLERKKERMSDWWFEKKSGSKMMQTFFKAKGFFTDKDEAGKYQEARDKQKEEKSKVKEQEKLMKDQNSSLELTQRLLMVQGGSKEEAKANFQPTDGQVRNKAPEIFWLARQQKKEDDQTQRKLDEIANGVLMGAGVSGGLLRGILSGLGSIAGPIVSAVGALGKILLKTMMNLGGKGFGALGKANKRGGKFKGLAGITVIGGVAMLAEELFGSEEPEDILRQGLAEENLKEVGRVQKLFSGGYAQLLQDKLSPEDRKNFDILGGKTSETGEDYSEEDLNKAYLSTIGGEKNEGLNIVKYASSGTAKAKLANKIIGTRDNQTIQAAYDMAVRNNDTAMSVMLRPHLGRYSSTQTTQQSASTQRPSPAPLEDLKPYQNAMTSGMQSFIGTKNSVNNSTAGNQVSVNIPVQNVAIQPSSTTMAQADLAQARDSNFTILQAQLQEQKNMVALLTDLKTTMEKSGGKGNMQQITQVIEKFSATSIMQELEGVR